MIAEANSIDNLTRYVELTLRLHELIAAGQGDSEDADAIRDQMYGPWRRLSAHEIALTDGLSADLNALKANCALSVSPKSDSELGEFQQAVSANDWASVLEVVRKYRSKFSTDDAAFIRGVCWAHLQQPNVAIRFFRETARLRQLTSAEEAWLLTAMYCANRTAEIVDRAREILALKLDPMLMLKAAEVLSVHAERLSESANDTLRREAIRAAVSALESAEKLNDSELLTTQKISVLRRMTIDYAKLGNLPQARITGEQALALDPNNLYTAMLLDSLQESTVQPIPNAETRRDMRCGYGLPSGTNWPHAAFSESAN